MEALDEELAARLAVHMQAAQHAGGWVTKGDGFYLHRLTPATVESLAAEARRLGFATAYGRSLGFAMHLSLAPVRGETAA
ncbi:MAG: hypothetical protein L6R00_06400 [Phycisphaerae bacterium]|nr:hypothetical protein [Phycisphaerae bacterium]